jgi:pimeloyl-ACP methyl ester carboxylesterase
MPSAYQVMPEGKWPRPFPHTKIDGYTPDYLAAKARVSVEHVTLDSGMKICYFSDGDKSGVPMICLHGGGESKWMWLQKEPVPGAWMIAIDRPGYGDSDALNVRAVDYTFHDICKDIGEFVTKLGVDQFVICSFSIGTSWAQQLAVAMPERVRGIILFGTMADTGHPDCPKALAKKIGKPPSILDPNGGCLGFILRGAFSGPVKAFQKYDFSAPIKDDSKDKRCAPRFQAWINDPFWVQMKVDDCLGFNRPDGLLGDAYRSLFGSWPLDVKKIKCPVFIFSGEFDKDMGSTSPHAADFVQQCVPHAQKEFIPGCGHASTVCPTQATRDRIVKALEAMPSL